MTAGTLDPGDLERDVAAILGLGEAPPAAVPPPMPAGAGWRRHALPVALLVAATGGVAVMLTGWPGAPPAHRPATIGRMATVQVRLPHPQAGTRVPAAVAMIALRDAPRPAPAGPPPRTVGRAVARADQASAPAAPPRAAFQLAPAPSAGATDTGATRVADVQRPSAPEQSIGSTADAPPIVAPDVRIALASSAAPSPVVAPPTVEPPPARRLKTQRSIDAIRLLRRQ